MGEIMRAAQRTRIQRSTAEARACVRRRVDGTQLRSCAQADVRPDPDGRPPNGPLHHFRIRGDNDRHYNNRFQAYVIRLLILMVYRRSFQWRHFQMGNRQCCHRQNFQPCEIVVCSCLRVAPHQVLRYRALFCRTFSAAMSACCICCK